MKQKIDGSKVVLLCFFLFSITCSIIPIIFGFDLFNTNNYQSFYHILNEWYINYSYFAKIIINNLDYMNFSIVHILQSLFYCLSIMNLIVLFITIYLYCAKHERGIKPYYKYYEMIVAIYFISYASMACVLIFGFKISTLNAVIVLFHYCGIIMMVCHTLIIAVVILALIHIIKKTF